MQISIVVRCPDRLSEVIPAEPEYTEFVIEDCVSRALLELFGMVVVENVKISNASPEYEFDDASSHGA